MGVIRGLIKRYATACRVVKTTLKHYSWVPSRLQAHTSLNRGFDLNCGIRVESPALRIVQACLRLADRESQPYFRCSFATAVAPGAWAGKLISTRVPTLGVLLISNLPPMISAMRRATVSPRPRPEKDLIDELSA